MQIRLDGIEQMFDQSYVYQGVEQANRATRVADLAS